MTETNAEWLEGIRWANTARPLTREEAHRLIEQAERARELEVTSAEWEKETYIQEAKNKRIESENKRLREAIKDIRERVVKECPHTDISFEIYDRCNTALGVSE